MPFGDYCSYSSPSPEPSESSSASGYASPEPWYYAVAVGARTGIFTDYFGEVERLTKGFPGALFKKFAHRRDAERFLFLRGVYERLEGDTDWYYAVAVGRCPGIYTHFADALRETSGFSGFRMKKFARFWEAEAFLSSHNRELLPDRCAEEDADGCRQWPSRPRPADAEDEPRHPQSLVAFCHGSVLRNGRADACAAVACVFPHRPARDMVGPLLSPAVRSSSRAELMAAVLALEAANDEDPHQTRTLFVFTSSEPLIRTMREWMHAWDRSSWHTVTGAPVKNRDVIEQLRELQGRRRIEWRHVLAHQEEVSTWEAHWSRVADRQARHSARVNDEMQRKMARIHWRDVELRYVPVSLTASDHGASELSLLAVLVVFRSRLPREILDVNSPRNAAVYPLANPRRQAMAQFYRLSVAEDARFGFGVEWRRSVQPPGNAVTATDETLARMAFRATSADEYARWKQVLGAALATPVMSVSVPRERFKSTSLPIETTERPLEVNDARDAHSVCHCDVGLGEATPVDGASVTNEEGSTLATRRDSDRKDDGSDIDGTTAACQQLDPGKRECDPAAYGGVGADTPESAHGLLSLGLRANGTAGLHDTEVRPKGLARICIRRERLEIARSLSCGLCPLDRVRVQFHATLAVPAREARPTKREQRRSSSLSRDTSIECAREEGVTDGSVASSGGNAFNETGSACEAREPRGEASATVRADAQSITRQFEAYSWKSRESRRRSALVQTKPQWRGSQSTPASFDRVPFSECDGFSWRVTPASGLQRQRYRSIWEVNREIERRVRALLDDSAPLDDNEALWMSTLLPSLTIQPRSVPPSMRSAFEESCYH